MNSTAVIDSKEVDALFKRLGAQFSKDIVKALDKTAQVGIGVILNRTAKGKGYETRFRGYSPEYAEFRSKRGRQSKFVDLNFTGQMLSGIRRKLDKTALTAEISFTNALAAKKAFHTNRTRPWFGFNQREKNYLRRFFYGVLFK